MNNHESAMFLDVPEAVIANIRRKAWGAVTGYFKYRWNQDGYTALKRNQGAVERVIKYFQGLKQYPVVSVSFEARKTIAMYIERLGVGTLLDDMKAAITANPKIKTLNYFIVNQKGEKTPRWGMLYFDLINKDWERRKAEYMAAPDLGCAIGEKLTPEWVADARKRVAELTSLRLPLGRDDAQELATLRGRIERYESRDSKTKTEEE